MRIGFDLPLEAMSKGNQTLTYINEPNCKALVFFEQHNQEFCLKIKKRNKERKKSICGFFIRLYKPGMFHQRISSMTWKKKKLKIKRISSR